MFKSEMPKYNDWLKLSGGKENRRDPLIQYIDKRVKDHETYYAGLCRKYISESMWIVLGCLTELLYATRMYTTAYRGERMPADPGHKILSKKTSGHKGLSKKTFGVGRIKKDGRRRVLAPRYRDDPGWNRYDAVDALEAIIERELCGLLRTRNTTDLNTKIANAEVCIILPEKVKVDEGKGDFGSGPPAIYLNVMERSEYRVLFDRGIAKMRHTSDTVKTPFDWVPADTPDNANSCAKDLFKVLMAYLKDEVEFKRGEKKFRSWYTDGGKSGAKISVSGYALAPKHKLFMSFKHRGSTPSWDSTEGTAGFFHSAYTSGEGVVCSGSVKFEKGIPRLVTNCSGHYTPEARKLDYMIRLFEITGVPTDRMAIVAQSGPKTYWFYNPGELDEFRMDLSKM